MQTCGDCKLPSIVLNNGNDFVSDVMPVNFEGGKLMINKAISNHFQVRDDNSVIKKLH